MIPSVDMEGFLEGHAARRDATAGAIRSALESHGFLYLRNHGVPEEDLEAVFSASRAFFALSQREKDAVKPSEAGSTRGYGGLAAQALDENRPGDLKEIFQAGSGQVWTRRNAWPMRPERFRESVLRFHEVASAVCLRLMGAMAVSLGLPPEYFERFYDRSDSTLRLLHYPAIDTEPAEGQLRAGAHTDFGGLNLLFQDAEGGLEIQAPDGTWVAAPAIPGTGIVNTGDLIQRWTNGMFRSSPHRVVNPDGARARHDRYSVVLFHSPNRDAVISCLAPCRSPGQPARYPPVTAGEHMQSRIQASRPHDQPED